MKPHVIIIRLLALSCINPAALALVAVVLVELWQEKFGQPRKESEA